MKIGNKIQQVRKRLGITQSELGARLGVSGSMVGQWESNRRTPKYETIARIARALDASVEELFGLMDSPPLDDAADPCKAAEEYMSSITEARYVRAIEFSSSRYGHNIITYFRLLNEKGQSEAAKRVSELLHVPEYQLTETTEAPSTASLAESSTPANKPSEEPNQP